MVSRIIFISLVLGFVLLSSAVGADDRIEFDSSKYEIYYGDVDGDGDANDIYFRGLKRLIIIHGDIAIPIFGSPRDSYALISNGIFGYAHDKIDPPISEEMLASFHILEENEDIYYADFDGDGMRDALIRGAIENRPALIMHGGKSQEDALAVVYSGVVGSGANNISDRLRNITLKDVNRDDRVDIVLSDFDPLYADVAFLNSSAGFPYEKSFDLSPQTFPETLIGSTEIQFRVNEAGASTYTLPIHTPQGVAGVTPGVALSYSSSAGNGAMGVGWNVSASSVVTRCRPTLYQDGEALSVTLTSTDRFCLDGQRLMVRQGQTYGANNSVYRTEIDNFEFIKLIADASGEPNHFIAIGKDGTKRVYGGDAASRQELSGKTLSWALSETSDNTANNANKIHYSYAGDAAGFRLAKIEYANKKATIDFTYEERNDVLVNYVAGGKVVNDKRLKKVVVRDSGEHIRSYHINYQNPVRGNEFSRVASIQECTDTGDTSCLPAISFDWEMQDLSISSGKTLLSDLTPTSSQEVCEMDLDNTCIPTGFVSESSSHILVDHKTADINGDSCLDIIYSLYHKTRREFSVGYKLSRADCRGFDSGRFGGVSSGAPEYIRYAAVSSDSNARLNIIDYNTDGRADIALQRSPESNWEVYLAKPTSAGEWFISLATDASLVKEADFFMDVDANGLPDLVWFDDDTMSTKKMIRHLAPSDPVKPNWFPAGVSSYSLPADFYPAPPRNECDDVWTSESSKSRFPETPVLSDFNGDGKVDVGAYFQSSVTCVSYNDTGPPIVQPYSDSGMQKSLSNGESKGAIAAAGVTYTTHTRTAFVAMTLKGGAWEKVASTTVSNQIGLGTLPALMLAQDVNSDGMTDLIYRSGTQLYVKIFNGKSFGFAKAIAVPSTVEEKHLGFHDRNADGYVDLYYSSAGKLMVMTWDPLAEQYSAAEFAESFNQKDAFFFADADGDGVEDYFIISNGLDTEAAAIKKLYVKREQSDGAHNKIIRHNNGFGSQTEVSYARLNEEGDHYNRLEVGYADREVFFTHRYCRPHDDGEPGCVVVTETRSNIVNDARDYYRQLYNPFRLSGNSSELKRPVFDLNPPMHVVTQVKSSSPTAANPDAKVSLRYRYSEAKAQAGGRGYLGFRTITTVDEQTLVETESEYYQHFPLTGQPKATVVKDRTGAIMKESLNYYPETVADTSKVYRVLLEQSTERQYATRTNLAVPGKFETTDEVLSEVVTTQVHDSFGNVARLDIKTTGKGTLLEGGEEVLSQHKVVESEYSHPSNARLFIHGENLSYEQLGRLTSVVTTGSRNGQVQTQKEVSFTYYTNGLLKEERVEPDLDDVDKHRFQTVTTHYYDAYGNEVRTELKGWDGEADVVRKSYQDFDDQGRYIVSKRDGENRTVESYSNFNRYGSPQTITGVNGGKVATLEFDALNRQLRSAINTANALVSTTRYLSCAQAGGCPRGAQYVITGEVDQGASVRDYFDKMGRVIRKAKQNFHGRWVYVDTQFDIFGRVIAVSHPHEGAASYWTRSEYDDLGRILKITEPANAAYEDGFATSSISYDGTIVTTTNPLGHKKVEAKNTFGELAWVRDETTGAQHASLKYVYNVEGSIERVEKLPSEGGVVSTSLSYDRFNRKVAMHDSDKGDWRYFYNAFGELVTQLDGKGQAVISRYDNQGRILSRTDRTRSTSADELAGAVEAHTRWYYDGDTDSQEASSINEATGLLSAVVMSRSVGDRVCNAGSSDIIQCEYPQYDTYSRQVGTLAYMDTDLDPQTALEMVSTQTIFDPATGRVSETRDAMSGVVKDGTTTLVTGTRNGYNDYGYLSSTHDLQTGALLYETKRVNLRGQVAEANLGPYSRYLGYDPATGQLETQVAYTSGLAINGEPNAFTIQHLSYRWDVLGNLQSRHNQNADGSGGNLDLKESFCYDELNRLVKTHIGNLTGSCVNLASADQDIRYDSIGNITYKRGVGAYDYVESGASDDTKIHAVRAAGPTRYWYDDNGNMSHDSHRSFTYSTFDKPVLISKGDYSAAFGYGINRSRYVQKEVKDGQVQKITAYIGNIERIYRPADQSYEWRRQVVSGVVKTTTDSDFTVVDDGVVDYIFKDHLGSVDVVADSGGNVLQSMSFDPWGARRSEVLPLPVLTAMQLASLSDSFITSRGYTGHEMLDELGLIHMNGRIYDATLARFLQADPFVQAPTDVQMYNRYSYVRNNPLNATDPSGYILARATKEFGFAGAHHFLGTGGWDFGTAYLMNAVNRRMSQNDTVAQWAPTVVAVVTSVFCGPCSIGISAMVTADITYYRTGSWKAAARAGAISAAYSGITYGIGQGLGAEFPGDFAGELSGVGYALKIMSHGVVGGVMAEIQGGNFGNGFLSAGLSAAVSSLAPGGDGSGQGNIGVFMKGVAISALVGGTVSSISGGKFANGARSGAIVYALNSATTKVKSSAQKGADSDIGGYSPVAGEYFNENGDLVSVDVAGYGGLVSSDGLTAYDFDHRTGLLVNPLATGAASSVCPECYLMGGGRLIVAGGYKAIAFFTGRAAPTYANFARGSFARNTWKVATGGQFLRLGAKPASFYWAKAGGNFSQAVTSLGRSNAVWNQRLIPLLPIGVAGDVSNGQ